MSFRLVYKSKRHLQDVTKWSNKTISPLDILFASSCFVSASFSQSALKHHRHLFFSSGEASVKTCACPARATTTLARETHDRRSARICCFLFFPPKICIIFQSTRTFPLSLFYVEFLI